MATYSMAIARAEPRLLIAGAVQDAARQATEDAARAQERIRQLEHNIARLASRLVYSTAYRISYGIVYTTLFVANSIPKENLAVRGTIDGARAAIKASKRHR